MSYVACNISDVVLDYINRTTFLPAIQREFVWERDGIEKLFDSLMNNYPIGSFLFWKIREENKDVWTAYKFIQDFDEDNRHNVEAVMAGINQDIYLVLDGQQRLTALYLGLRGTYRYLRYKRWRKTKLYLNLFKLPTGQGIVTSFFPCFIPTETGKTMPTTKITSFQRRSSTFPNFAREGMTKAESTNIDNTTTRSSTSNYSRTARTTRRIRNRLMNGSRLATTILTLDISYRR